MYREFLVHITILLAVVLALSGISRAELVGYWKLDENSGNIAYDSTGNGLDGTLSGDASWVEGLFGSALELDGIGDHVEMPPVGINSNTVTMTAWIKRNGPQTDSSGIFFQRDIPASTAPLGLMFNDEFEVDYIWNNNSQELFWKSRLGVANNEWTFVALVVEPNQVTIYVNENTAVNQVDNKVQNFTAPLYIGWDNYKDNRHFNGQIDDVRIYDHSLKPEEIQVVMTGAGTGEEFASIPNPENESANVVRDNVNLSWKPGVYADTHDLYFGTIPEDINDADALNSLSVLVSPNYEPNNYALERLDFNQTYYWRVDEISAAPNETVFKGETWSFTVEPFAHVIPSENIIATASSQACDSEGPENTINGSGVNPDDPDQHSNEITEMWISEPNDSDPWIQYEFDKAYKLYQMLVWNYNGQNILVYYGLKDVLIEYSADGINWLTADISEFAQAPGVRDYVYNTIVDFAESAVKYVRIEVKSNYGNGESVFNSYGLSEVRFLHIPVHARNPKPAVDIDNVNYDGSLAWQPGRDAAEHNVYLSTDEQTVKEGSAFMDTVNQPDYNPLPLDIGTKYYWRVDEVNNAEEIPLWEGRIWSFTTQDYLVVDDFEDYNDHEPYRIFDIWQDGYYDPTNGSTIGNPEPVFGEGEHFVETDIVYAGKQSTQLVYDNTISNRSEVTVNTLLLDINRDWTVGSPKVLVFWFYGDPANLATEQLYVKINNKKILFSGDIVDITKPVWSQCVIDFSEVDLSNVSMLAIGLEKTGATGSAGKIYIDELRLYRTAPEISSEEI
ncbi:LamG-like jellyroll fold domain-containing protein [Planctomycetota bacterium]